jgi:hypothetical protein
MSCTNNLKQIALAAHNYESANGYLPPGGVGPGPAATATGFSWAAPHNGVLSFLLPYVEQDNLYNRFATPQNPQGTTGGLVMFENDPPVPPTTVNGFLLNSGWYTNSVNFALAQTNVKTYVCPSDPRQPTQTGTFITTFMGATTFTGGYYGNPTGELFGRTNYTGSGGSIGPAQTSTFYARYKGPFYNRSKEVISTIGDGTSNTALFGEILMGTAPGTRDFAAAWIGVGYMAHAWGISDPSTWYRFSSKHPGVVNFALGDGSVRNIRKGVGTTFFTTDWYDYNRFGGGNDGEVIGGNLLR